MDCAGGPQDELGGLEVHPLSPFHVEPETVADIVHVQTMEDGEVEPLVLLHCRGPLLVVRREGHGPDVLGPKVVQLGLQTGQLPVAVASPVTSIEGDERPRALEVVGELHGIAVEPSRGQRGESVSVLQSRHDPSSVRSLLRLRALDADGAGVTRDSIPMQR